MFVCLIYFCAVVTSSFRIIWIGHSQTKLSLSVRECVRVCVIRRPHDDDGGGGDDDIFLLKYNDGLYYYI